MTQKKRGLGRGLSELGLSELLGNLNKTVPAKTLPANTLSESESKEKTGQLQMLLISQISPGRYQPRKTIAPEALEELANSIRTQGIIQPIVVRPMGSNYELIAGERRWRAAELAGLTHVPAIVRTLPDKTVIALSLIENIQRQDLNAIEESEALQRLITEFNMTHQEVAESVGKSRSAITNLLRLQNLNADVKSLVEKKYLEMGHARALLALEGPQQSDVAREIIAKACSVRETEQIIQKLLKNKALPNNTGMNKLNSPIQKIKKDYLFANIPAALPKELFTDLVKTKNFKLERIVSKGHSTPKGEWCDQEKNEWVLVIEGKATLIIEGEKNPVILKAGDYLLIPAHTRHRVESTDPDAKTVWLVLHF